ncbi:hypothetical protein C2E23DRAFT_738604 [Lenzites betulinus]|nr:hypothetical protein C2E23DRAFT_738604 [Lenzites betulinus]
MVDEPAKKKRKATEDSEEIVAVPGPPRGAAKKTTPRTEPTTNGAPKSSAAKGKGRADPPPKTGRVNGTSTEEVAERGSAISLDDGDDPPDPPRGTRGGSKQPKAKSGHPPSAPARPNKTDAKLAREADSLRAQLEQTREFTKEVDKLAKQLEDVFRTRNTEPEETLQEYKTHFEAEIRKKDILIEELTLQLTKLRPTAKSDQPYTLHFLTREAAEEEKTALREENSRLKETIKQRDGMIAAKVAQISALEDESKVVKKELDAEIERSKSLALRPAHSAPSRQQKPSPHEFQNTPVIRLYEDMTNILITSVKMEKSPEFPDLDEDILTCIYTYQNAEEGVTFSLNFTLRNTFDRPEGTEPAADLTKDQLVVKVKYEPKDLDKENQDLVGRLGFFKDPFMFARDQMTVFLKTLTDNVAGMFEPEHEGEGDDSADVIIVDE